MSHLSELKTEVRSLELARRTAAALGIPVLEGAKGVCSFYAPYRTDCDLVMGTDHASGYGYNVGLQKQANGTYSFVSDVYDIADKTMLKKIGDDYDAWTTETRNGIAGHVNTGKPNRFMQEYALQAGELGAKVGGMRAFRMKQANGDVWLKVTGGAIPLGAYVLIVARKDGSSSYSAHGVKGKSCLRVSDWAKKLLGQVTSQKFTAEFYHEETQAGQVVHTGSLR